MKSNKGAKNIDETAVTLFEIIQGLVAELHPRRLPVQAVSLDSLLDRDLGLDSLARVELLARIERSFGVVLQERVFADAETPRDLLRAVFGAGGRKVTHAVHEISKMALGEVGTVPHEAHTLIDVLNWHVLTHPDQSFLFYAEGTFTRMPGLMPFHMGAFVAATEGKVPVIPIAIRGTRSILRPGSWIPRRGAITITICKPIEPEELKAQTSVDPWTIALKLRNAVREQILRFSGEPDLAHEKSPI